MRIPDLSQLREIKDEYPDYPIDADHPLHEEEMVPIAEFDIAGQSYYSKPNKMTGEPLPGINPDVLVRYTVAEKLEAVNREVRASRDISKLLGGPTEIIVQDGLRSRELQKHLFEVVWPKVLQDANPDWDDEKLALELPKFIAKPKSDDASPTPHMTGGAMDINLIFQNGKQIDFGHIGGKEASLTDFYESDTNPENDYARSARRILYWTLDAEGFANNPTEWWHYSYGDQMWAMFKGEPAAIYGAVKQAPDLIE